MDARLSVQENGQVKEKIRKKGPQAAIFKYAHGCVTQPNEGDQSNKIPINKVAISCRNRHVKKYRYQHYNDMACGTVCSRV